MPYRQVDLLIFKMDELMAGSSVDPFLESHFAALVTVVSVAAFERRIKDIFCDFGASQNSTFGLYVKNDLGRINGRISIKSLKEQYLNKFGKKYIEGFKSELDILKNDALSNGQPNPAEFYDSLISARHNFVHELNVKLPKYKEVKEFYLAGVTIISALERTFNSP